MMFPPNISARRAHTFVYVIPDERLVKRIVADGARRHETRATFRLAPAILIRMAPDLQIRSGLTIPAAELRWKFSRSSGPGGQSVNTTDSRVSLSFDVVSTNALDQYLKARAIERLKSRLVDGVVTVHAEGERSQYQNRIVAQEQLAKILRAATAPPPPKRRPTRPSRRAKDRRIAGKKQRGETKRLRRSIDD